MGSSPSSRLLFLGLLVLMVYGISRSGLPDFFHVLNRFHAAPAEAAGSKQERVLHQQLRVASGGTLHLQVPASNVQIVTGSSEIADVSVFLSGRNTERARQFFASLTFKIETRGDDLYVQAEAPQRRFSLNSGSGGLLVRVHVPERFNANVATSGGNIELASLIGSIQLRTSGGNISLARVAGPEIVAKTSGGNIRADLLNGSVDLGTSGGNITLGEVRGSNVRVRTSGGNIRLRSLDAEGAEVRTSGGSITIEQALGNTTAHTSGGNVRIGGVEGGLAASTSGGSIQVDLIKPADVTLRTSGGSIQIVAPASLQAELLLRGSSVRVGSNFDFSGRITTNQAEGRIGGGGARLNATASGSISLAPAGS